MEILASFWTALVLFSHVAAPALAAKQSYVVYLGGQQEELEHHLVADYHHKILGFVLGSTEEAKNAIFYSYTRAFNGFAAHLDEEHALALLALPEVLSVFPNQGRKLHTTRSWNFLGLERAAQSSAFESVIEPSLWKRASFGKEVIVANLDTGVWPESASFDDAGFGPVPSRWRGYCENGTEFGPANCNRKLIGARYFVKGYEAANGPVNGSVNGKPNFRSPRDADGHGTHTLSTAAGNFVRGANVFGYGQGTAKGGAPHARVVTYKVCWPPNPQGSECYDADILKAFDTGVYEGVDVFSVSVGSSVPLAEYFMDGISIGSFHAVQRGRIVVCSAGNDGPKSATVTNVAPWILTVAASSIDRSFPSIVKLGDNTTYTGQSVSEFRLPENKMYPLVSSINVKYSTANDTAGNLCFIGALNPEKVKGKIVACLRGTNARVEKGEAVRIAGGVGMILCNAAKNADEVVSDSHILPATQLNAADGQAIFDYINSTRYPVAYISPATTKLDTRPAPMMAAFSSQGPNSLTHDILKPDITAPGLNILAAYSRASSPTGFSFDKRHLDFNIVSGTSMSCPHVSGVAALLRGAHPRWSPAAIKSAIMTTATTTDNDRTNIMNASHGAAGPFNYGSGHVDPNEAVSPGLVYDLSNEDYLKFFCSLNYNSTQIKAITGKNLNCPAKKPSIHNFNYPSITVSNLKGSITLKRTVTNVESEQHIYHAQVHPPPGISVSVTPKVLNFSKAWESKSFTVTMKASKSSDSGYVFGSLKWVCSKRVVTSPIVANVQRSENSL